MMYHDHWDKGKVALILDEACSDGRAGRALKRMWQKDLCNPQIMIMPGST